MSIIDVQNAKAIRDPMAVSVTLDARELVSFTVTASSPTPVVNVPNHIQDPYPLRLLADLKAGGFPLDGSRVLLDSSTPETAADGKLSIRSHTGGNMVLNISSSARIANLTISAINCARVTVNSVAYDMSNGSAVIPINGTSATLSLIHSTTDDRIEIAYIIAGVRLSYSNEDLISCEVNLRSDLSPIDPIHNL